MQKIYQYSISFVSPIKKNAKYKDTRKREAYLNTMSQKGWDFVETLTPNHLLFRKEITNKLPTKPEES